METLGLFKKKAWAASLLLMMAQSALAHPTAFQGSTALISNNLSGYSENIAYYSARSYLSVGAAVTRIGTDEFYAPHVGLLLKRWNEKESQANIYAWGGYGLGTIESEGPRRQDGIWRWGAQADYETRRFYTMVSINRIDGEHGYFRELLTARVGFAPYLADFEGLSIWPILQVMKWTPTESTWDVMPMLRFYYKNVLWEMGSSVQGNWMFSFMVHHY